MAKVKFRFGVKAYSGTIDELVFANYDSRNVCVARMPAVGRELTANNASMGQKMSIIAALWRGVNPAYKTQLSEYSIKMFNLPEYDGALSGNNFSVFLKLIWAASYAPEIQLDILSLSVDDLNLGTYDWAANISHSISLGLLPVVEGSDLFTTSIVAS